MIKVELPANSQTYTALSRLFTELAGADATVDDIMGREAERQVAREETPPAPPAEVLPIVPAQTAATVFSNETAPLRPEGVDGPAPLTEVAAIATAPVELDTNGLPWDYRIHAASKGRVAGGTWRYKKGVDKIALVHRVEAELRAAIAATKPSALAMGPVATPEAFANAAKAAETRAPVTAVGVYGPAVATSTPTTFPELTQRMTTNPIPKETLDAALASVGLASFTLLATRPDLIPDVEAALFPGGV